jgi:tetratricopeptide (TPR) repeat protein
MTRIRIYHLIGFLTLLVMAMPLMVKGQTTSELAKADTLMEREDFAGALPIYDKLIAKSKFNSPEDYNLLYKRAYCHYGLGKFDAALADINRFIQKTPDPQAKILRAYINQELGNSQAQLDDLNEFVDINPDNAELLRWRASVLMDLEKYTEARKDIRKILAQDQNPDIKGYLGLTYYYSEDADSALMIFDEVIAEAPNNVQTYVYASSLALQEEAYPLAVQYIDKGLKLDPANTTLQFYKGIALVESEKTDEGCRCLNKAFSDGFDDAGDYLKEYCYGVH